MRYEIFDPRDGVPILKTRFGFIARLICRLVWWRFLDYAQQGKGWV